MRKLLWGLAAALGIMGAVIVHGSLMIVEQDGSEMLPAIEPGQKVLIYLPAKEYNEGDIVAFEPPYYTVDGSKIKLRHIDRIDENTFILVSGEASVKENRMKVDRKDIIGKAVFYG